MKNLIDLHCDSVSFLMDGVDLRRPNPAGHVDLDRLRKGGVGVQVFAAFVSSSIPENRAFAAARAMLDKIDEFAGSDPLLAPVETAADCRRVMDAGKTGVLRAVENGWALENSLDNLEALRRRGARILTLVHSRHTSWAASCTDAAAFPGGLSPFGLEVVDRMNRLGMIVDVSHASEGTFWDAMKRSRLPVIASHSCAHALCASPRNLKDEQIRAIGAAGGLIGVCFFPVFLSETFRRAKLDRCDDLSREGEELERRYARGAEEDLRRLWIERKRLDRATARRMRDVPVPLSLIADHIDYIAGLAGEDAVALGSDFDGVFALPDGVTGCDCYPLLEAELRRRGYSPGSLEKFFSGNFLRVLGDHDRA